MSGHIHLVGAQQVDAAGHRIADAAERMSQAALNIDGAFERNQRFMEDWLFRLEGVMAMSEKKIETPVAEKMPSTDGMHEVTKRIGEALQNGGMPAVDDIVRDALQSAREAGIADAKEVGHD